MYVSTFILEGSSQEDKKTGGSLHHSEAPGAEEVDVTIPKAPIEPAGTHAELPETNVMDNIPDVQVKPSGDENIVVEASQKNNLNPPSPLKTTKDVVSDEETVVITVTGHTTPVHTVLAKHTAKSATTEVEKGKAKLELQILKH